ncbi:hypothetical protein CEUSTIGMA_g432.t1 [Chlamydomonas eustigma]|uniref:DNA repair protein RecN n=1 Tax=Chlamydomonas eustigma TaxID=1157962 RepID=A0A250WQZ7_9CHLO|nr:hypothetical protein CEUSTIGMA_g432.t1 [Chlamydomonas eustigma]|eukprot:GAX72980.1 hypothetical protein CEUSTIGMA_g432.t1 [Chlamydomonas eustigma]
MQLSRKCRSYSNRHNVDVTAGTLRPYYSDVSNVKYSNKRALLSIRKSSSTVNDQRAMQDKTASRDSATPHCLDNSYSLRSKGGMLSSDPQKPSHITSLHQLSIKDFALVSENVIQFSPGLNVITGESGSGKSVLVEALNLINGGAAPNECVRAPAACAVVEGTYFLDSIASAAVHQLLVSSALPGRALPTPGEPCSLIVRREILQVTDPGSSSRSTRSRCYVNGVATSLRVLRDLGTLLVDGNNQHAALALRDSANHLQLLDRVAGTTQLAAQVQKMVMKARNLEEQLAELDELADEEERDSMQALCDAVSRLEIEENEELSLRQTLKNMESRRASVEQCAAIRGAVVGGAGSGGDGIVQALRSLEVQLNLIMKQEQQISAGERAARAAEKAASRRKRDDNKEEEDEDEDEEGEDNDDEDEKDVDSDSYHGGAASVSQALEALALAREQLGTAEGHIRSYARSFQFDAGEHQDVSDRLKAIEKLMKSHGCRSTAQLLQEATESADRLQAFYEAEEHEEEWEEELEGIQHNLHNAVIELSARRHAAAARMAAAVDTCLGDLAMSRSKFDVKITMRPSQKELPISQGVFITDMDVQRVKQIPQTHANSKGHDSDLTETMTDDNTNHMEQDLEPESSMASPSGSSGMWYRYPGPHQFGGVDHVEFLLAAGPSEPLRPLSQVASGGESARVMLALKAAPSLAQNKDGSGPATNSSLSSETSTSSCLPSSSSVGAPVLILDELDSSIGARLGSAVGKMLRRMCTSQPRPANGQIICVTHLPQVACYADLHVRVKKAAFDDGRTGTVFEALLKQEQRIEEIAAMLGLEQDVAAEMLKSSK